MHTANMRGACRGEWTARGGMCSRVMKHEATGKKNQPAARGEGGTGGVSHELWMAGGEFFLFLIQGKNEKPELHLAALRELQEWRGAPEKVKRRREKENGPELGPCCFDTVCQRPTPAGPRPSLSLSQINSTGYPCLKTEPRALLYPHCNVATHRQLNFLSPSIQYKR